MFNIKTLNKISPLGTGVLKAGGCAVADDAVNPAGILVRSADMRQMELGDELLAVARAGTGVNNIPVDRCTNSGIAVFNTPGANAEAVKELAICALLMSSRDVLGGVRWVSGIADGGEEIPKLVEKGKSSFSGPEISGKALGVIGLGAIGAKIANTALALGMDVWGHDPFLSVDAAWQLSRDVHHALDLDTIYRSCDYITLHVPYAKETHHILGADAFSKVRDGVRIINLARGELVDDEALLKAMDTAKVACYVTDFPNKNLINVPNVVAMPHLGASTPESEEKCAVMAAQQLLDYLINGNIKNSVNLPNVYLERMGAARLCVIHMNVPRMITGFLELIGSRNFNVEHMINRPRGEYAYTIIDTNTALGEDIIHKICAMEGVLKVRAL